ncbi:MAG: TlpA family protein disulfide reductase [Alphaproteobacteria bacterium]|nr:TlpA family protein disulfide reductase [Alphaproteobacteria bacterium]
MSWIEGLRRRLATWDAQAASATLAGFEARHGLDLRSRRVVVASLDAARRALHPDGRPLVEHHWASWCEPCLDELDVIERLAERLGTRADVVGVSWDRLDSADEAPETTRARVADLALRHGLSWPTLVLDTDAEALFAALSVPVRTVPFTRVLDADGGVLRTVQGPLSAADVDDITQLVGV